MKRKKKVVVAGVILLLTGVAVLWLIGGTLIAPQPRLIGEPPPDFPVQSITMQSEGGSTLKGWWIPGQHGKGAIVLMHGIRSNRLGMLERAKFLAHEGYGVLLFDFQAHGESSGAHITLGKLESQDAITAVAFAHAHAPGEKIAVIGTSLGGAAALLAEPPLDIDAMIVESSYPTLQQAVEDRLARRLGSFAKVLAPLLTCQLRPRLGFSVDDLRPIDHVGSLKTPKLFIAGADDLRTTAAESKALFAAAAEPKEFWLIEGAAHVDMHTFNRPEYEKRVLAFLKPHMQTAGSTNN